MSFYTDYPKLAHFEYHPELDTNVDPTNTFYERHFMHRRDYVPYEVIISIDFNTYQIVKNLDRCEWNNYITAALNNKISSCGQRYLMETNGRSTPKINATFNKGGCPFPGTIWNHEFVTKVAKKVGMDLETFVRQAIFEFTNEERTLGCLFALR